MIKRQPPLTASLVAVLLVSIGLGNVASAQQQSTKVEEETLSVSTQVTLEQERVQTIPNEEVIKGDAKEASVDSASTRNGFDVLSAYAWMRRLASTVEQVSFEVSYVVSHSGKEVLPYVWRHAVLDEGGTAEQLSLINGPGFEQIRINDKVSIFEPGFEPISINANVIDGPIPNAFIRNPEVLNQSYDMLLMGRNRISGRMAQQIRVISKDKSRYQYHLWLDEQTGLLLKTNMYDLQGGLLKQIQVTQLTINTGLQSHFAAIQENQLPPTKVTERSKNQQLPWTLDYIPVGMQVVTENLRRISLTGQPAEYMMVSDGLVDVSVYVMKAPEVVQEDIALTTDATSIVSISDGRVLVTVVGEIPLETATKIANSIVLVQERP